MALGEPVAGGAEVARGDKAGSDVRFALRCISFLLVFLSFITACDVKLDLQMWRTCLTGLWCGQSFIVFVSSAWSLGKLTY